MDLLPARRRQISSAHIISSDCSHAIFTDAMRPKKFATTLLVSFIFTARQPEKA
jgi:hypothetical protein